MLDCQVNSSYQPSPARLLSRNRSPRLELNVYGKRDEARGIGSGLSDGAAGLRLRYEFTRQIAPYVGVERTEKFGKTADLTRAAGEKADETRWVAGVRFWF